MFKNREKWLSLSSLWKKQKYYSNIFDMMKITNEMKVEERGGYETNGTILREKIIVFLVKIKE